MTSNWRDRAGTSFQCQKQPATGSRGMVVSNHPLASAAGRRDAGRRRQRHRCGVATLFALTVVEPMMVGLIGGGMAHIRLADGSHRFIDGQSTVPRRGRPTCTPDARRGADVFDTGGDEKTWSARKRSGARLAAGLVRGAATSAPCQPADVMQPAIRHAARGFAVTPYLYDASPTAPPICRADKPIAAIYCRRDAAEPGERAGQAD